MLNLARKYRPHCLDELVGQPSVVRTLTNAFKAKSLHQAYLFVGQFGSGKTTAARIVAAMENAAGGPTLHPGKDDQIAQKIFDGQHTDVEEIDAASGAGKAEHIRQLKNSAMYHAVDGCRTKYYIIDECHRMSPEANDALLKLLEEPPGHVRFILCTTDPQSMRPAIESRCQRHDFRKIFWTLIAERLKHVAKVENVKIQEDAVSIIAKMANGSMRNGLQFLEKVISYAGSGAEVTVEHAQQMFGTIGDKLYYDLLDEVFGVAKADSPDATSGLTIINEMLQSGVEFDVLYDGLAERLRNVLVCLTATGAAKQLVLTPDSKSRLKAQFLRCREIHGVPAVINAIKCLNDAKSLVRMNMSLEVALQQWFVESMVAFRALPKNPNK